MGLDVYLEYCENWADKLRLEKEFNEKVESQDINYDTPEWNSLSEELGLLDGRYPTETVEIDSTLYPEHMFKIGYFRSSYNAGGLNHILRTRIGKDLYYIFEEGSEDYNFIPNWKDAAYRCSLVINEFNDSLQESGKYQVATISSLISNAEINSEKAALNVFISELSKEKKTFPFEDESWYLTKAGHFMFGGITVYAAIEGVGVFPDKPATYLIYKADDDWAKWYKEALEIVQETIDWVLASDNPNNYGFTWSG